VHKIKHVWERITSLENIEQAILCASRNKKSRRLVQKVLSDRKAYALKIQKMLLEKTFKPTKYVPIQVRDGASNKIRLIHKPAFYPDQIVHWALVLPFQDVWEKRIYPLSCGSIPGRGLHRGARAMKRWLSNDRKGTKYCYKIDIRKYYPSVDLDILYGQFCKQVADKDALWLFDKVIHSHAPGLPIGNYTSQWFANLYLSGFDWWVRQELGAKYYVRYIDDIVILNGNKKELHRMRRLIEEKLALDYHLTIKRTWQVFKVDGRGVDFLGYRFFHGFTVIRKRTAYRMARRIRMIGSSLTKTVTDASAVMSYLGIARHCDSLHFLQRRVLPFVSIFQCKEIHREACSVIAG
jgi:RNA-directed DNA polymerase